MENAVWTVYTRIFYAQRTTIIRLGVNSDNRTSVYTVDEDGWTVDARDVYIKRRVGGGIAVLPWLRATR